jgi:hypothetical protein
MAIGDISATIVDGGISIVYNFRVWYKYINYSINLLIELKLSHATLPQHLSNDLTLE